MVASIVGDLGLSNGEAAAALVDAAVRGWLIVEGQPPQSITLTDEGRAMVARLLQR
jgi:hypothetical protein